jgi:hypothetical protein
MDHGKCAYTFFVVSLSALLASCATIRADSDYYEAADFSQYRSYVWMAESPLIRSTSSRVEVSPLAIRRIREAIERDLAEKDFEPAATRDAADFAVSFTVGARDMITLEDYPPYYRGPWRWARPYYWPSVDVRMYTEGMLAIDIFDNATREPVWHGWAHKTILRSDVDNPEAAIDAAVAAILADFPPANAQGAEARR